MSDPRQTAAPLPPPNPGAVILPDNDTINRLAWFFQTLPVFVIEWPRAGCPLPGPMRPAPAPQPQPQPGPIAGDTLTGPDGAVTLFGAAAPDAAAPACPGWQTWQKVITTVESSTVARKCP